MLHTILEPAIALPIFYVLGLIMGSFGNVVIDRLPRGISLRGRSHCDSCGKTLTLWELVPVISWAVLRGECSKCKAAIPARFTVIEMVSGILFAVAITSTEFLPFHALLLSIAFWAMMVIAMIDKDTHSIPDVLTVILAVSLLGLQFLNGEFSFIPALIGFLFFGLQWAISKGRWVGSGDIFLAVALGLLFSSWQQMVFMLMAAYIIGAIIAAILLFSKKISRKAHVPFGPFLIIGALVTFFAYEHVLPIIFPYA